MPAWPDGTKHFKPAYVHTREELKVLILQMNAGRKAVQDRLRGIPPPCKPVSYTHLTLPTKRIV